MDGNECRQQVISEDYADYIGDLQVNSLYNQDIAEAFCTQRISERFVIIYEPLTEDAVWTDSYAAVPKCYGLMDMESLNEAGILKMQQYPGLELTGKDVILGFLDTGIDYQNTVFRGSDGGTRIAGIWDQTDQTGRVPAGFLYGSEYTKEQIEEALSSETPLLLVPETDESGHGTAVAAIAAGRQQLTAGFSGAAPEADIAVVKLKQAKTYLREYYQIRDGADAYQENDIMLGILYLQRLSYRLNKPLVICLALGTAQGDHAGNAPLDLLLNQFCMLQNRVVVAGTGNEANAGHHFQGKFNLTGGYTVQSYAALEDTVLACEVSGQEYQDVEIRVGEGEKGFCMELWAASSDLYAVSILSPSGERLPRVPVGPGRREEYQFLFEGTTVQIVYWTPEAESGDNMVFFRFTNPAAGLWSVRVYPVRGVGGSYHIWLPISSFLSAETYFLRSSPDVTLTGPSAAERILSVGAYNGESGGVDIDSGRGYSRKDIVKPELCAPGVNVLTVIPDASGLSGEISGGRLVRRTGTSMAAGIAAGAAALLLQWNRDYRDRRTMNTAVVKEYLTGGASQVSGKQYPNPECGYGRLDLYGSFEALRLR